MGTVFILGAGASRAAGGPLMHDFMDIAGQIFRRSEAGWAHEYFSNALTARQKLQSAFIKSNLDLDNIENLFATFEMASLIGKLSNMDDKLVEQLPKSLRHLIVRTLEQVILFPIDGKSAYVQAPFPYDAFAELLILLREHKDAGSIAVINFNYDLCLDYALSLKGFALDYGLGLVPTFRTNKVIAHYKVHGSLNWLHNTQTGEIAPQVPQPLPMRTYWNRLGLDAAADRAIDTAEVLYGPDSWGKHLHPEPIIVPPTWNKGWYQQQLKSVWQAAGKALAQAENIFVISYSLPPSDQFFRSFFSLSTISDAFIDKFWVFDPSTRPDIVDRYESLLGPAVKGRGKFRFEAEKFTGAIRRIAESFGFLVESIPDR